MTSPDYQGLARTLLSCLPAPPPAVVVNTIARSFKTIYDEGRRAAVTPRQIEELQRLTAEIESLVEPWTRSGDAIIRQMAGRIQDRTRDLQHHVDDIRQQTR